MTSQNKILIITALLFLNSPADAVVKNGPDVNAVSVNINQRIDLSNLEYDDSPYPGRTNAGHIFIPFVKVETALMELRIGGWYRHIYVQYDEDESPEKMYPYMSAIFKTGESSSFLIGNFENRSPLPNTIYNEFLYFEERPVSSGMKYSLITESLSLIAYMDWLELDTEEHPEEFITGLIFEHHPFNGGYYKFYNHYHHRGGQLHKDTHPVRIEQDVVSSPVIGFRFWKLFIEGAYYLGMFSQNFEPTIYGHAGSGTAGFFTGSLRLSYQCFVNKDYYHQDAHVFYLKKENILHRIKTEYKIYSYKDILDLNLTVNLYGMDPPGIDMRLFAKIDLNLFEYRSSGEDSVSPEDNE